MESITTKSKNTKSVKGTKSTKMADWLAVEAEANQ